jgi:hypothetical protein
MERDHVVTPPLASCFNREFNVRRSSASEFRESDSYGVDSPAASRRWQEEV